MSHIQKQLFETKVETRSCVLAPPASTGPVTRVHSCFTQHEDLNVVHITYRYKN